MKYVAASIPNVQRLSATLLKLFADSFYKILDITPFDQKSTIPLADGTSDVQIT